MLLFRPAHCFSRSSIVRAFCLATVLATGVRADEIYPKRRTLTGHTASVLAVKLSPDGKTLVSGSRDDTIRIWDFPSGTLKQTLTPHEGDADHYAIAFSHDGALMASGGRSKKIVLWNAKTFEPLRTLEGHTLDIREVEFSADGRTLASVGEDNTFRLWDVVTGKLKVTRTEHTMRVKTVAYTPDGKTIVTAASDGTVRLWDAQTGDPGRVLEDADQGLEFCKVSPDGKQLFGGTGNIGELLFWDAQTGQVQKKLPSAHGNQLGKETDCGLYSPDGKWAISGSKDRSIRFWDTRTFQLLHSINGLLGRVESMTLSADGKTLITGCGGTDSTISIWDLTTMSGDPVPTAGKAARKKAKEPGAEAAKREKKKAGSP